MLTENLDTYFEAWGAPVACGAVNTLGILDVPGDVVLGSIVSDDYMLTFQTAKLPGLAYQSALTITHPLFGSQPTAFTVRDVRPHGDGALSVAFLSKT